MSKRIKGITIELDGSTTGLDKALEGVTKKSNKLYGELQQVERALKFNPGNAELVAQKQKLLGDQVENTRERLNKLKEAQADVDKQFASGKINEEQYRAFQREIIETESKLKHFETQLANSQSKLKAFGESAIEAGEKMKKVGEKTTEVGKSLTTKVTAPLMGVAAIAAKVGSDFEAGMSKVAAISGATGDDLIALTDKAREMGATTQFSATEASAALSYMAMAGWKTNDMLSGINGIMALAAASGEDLALTSDIVTDALTAFGMTAADSGKFADVLAAASSNANTNVAMLGESFKYVAPLAGAMGYTAEDTSLALGLMANAGVKASQAGTTLKTMFANMAKPTKAIGNGMDDLGISLTDAEGNMKTMEEMLRNLRVAFADLNEEEKARYASQIFGKEAMAGALAVINATEEDYYKLAEAINTSEGAAQKMAATMTDNLQGRMKEMQSALEEAAISIYDNLQPAIEKIVAFIKDLADWFNQLAPATQTTIIALAGVAAAIGPILVVLGTLIASLGVVFTAIGTFSGALAVVTTGAAAATPAVGALAAVITALTGPIAIAVAAIIGIGAALVLAYNKVEWFRDGVNKIWEAIRSATKTAFDAVSKVIKSIVEDFVKFASEQLDRFKAFWDENGKQIMAIVKGYLGFILDNIKLVMGLIKGVFQVIWPIISGIVQVAWGVIKSVVSQGINLVLGIVQTVLKLLKGDWEGAWETIKGTAVKIVGNIVKFFQDVDLLQIGKDMIQGLINGISSMANAVVDRVKALADSLPEGIKKVLGIKSPSRVFMGIGEDTGMGLAIGIDSTKAANEKAVLGVAKVLSDAARKNAEEVSKIADDAEKKRTEIQKEYAKKRADLNLKTAQSSQSALKTHKNKKGDIVTTGESKVLKIRQDSSAKLTKLNEEEQNKLATVNNKAWADMVKKEQEISKERLEAVKTYVADKKSMNELSLIAETEVWRKSLALFNEGTKERVEIQKGYQAALKAVNDEVTKTNEEYAGKMTAINDRLREEEKKLTDEYTKTLNDRINSLRNFAGIFDEIDITVKKSGSELLANLQSQVSAFALWQQQIDLLATKAIDGGLIEELRAMGPKALPELLALNQLTDTQLTQYSALYVEKSKLAREQAEKELIGMKSDTQTRITELRATANTELEALRNEWVLKIQSITKATDDELQSLQQIGVNAGQGLLNGLASMEGALVAKATSIANAVSAAMANALQVKSPSRVTTKIGEYIGEGLIVGMENMLNDIKRVATRMGEFAVPSMPDIHVGSVTGGGRAEGGQSTDNSRTTINNLTVQTNESNAINEAERLLRRAAFLF